MAGLETIALAVAHLESIQDNDEQPPITVLSDSSRKNELGAELPYPKLHGRMVSDDSIYEVNSRSLAASSSEPPNSEMSAHARQGLYQQWPSNDIAAIRSDNIASYQALPIKHKSNVKQDPLSETGVSDTTHQESESNSQTSGPAGILLEKISMINEDLCEFFTLMDKLEHLVLPDGMKPAGIPKPDEVIFQVQRYDVLLGRGGETNHHVGNVHYRQLVKACQPAYLAAKRRDKPRIAVAIVQVVRAHSGRFLKKQAHECSWVDVGNIRAREKTSQALREGAPELRGTVESRSQLLIEAVENGLDKKPRHAMNGSNVEFNFDPRQVHLTNMHIMSNGNEKAPAGVNARATAKHNHSVSAQSTTETSNPISRTLIVPQKGMSHYAMHHHVPVPMVPGPMFYHHPHVMYHPSNVGMDARYHHIYSDTRAMAASSISEPPKKRQRVTETETTSVSGPANVSQHITIPPADTVSIEKNNDATIVSADNSEEEPVPVRSASPASSTSSAKNGNTCRGPRLKLLKQRFEGGASTEV